MSRKVVLAIGLDPAFADYSKLPGLTPELIAAHIEAQLDGLRAIGYEVTSCLVDLGETAETTVKAALKSRSFDCIVVGAGLREPAARLALFETIINLVHEFAPTSRIAFNTSPADTAEAVQRWTR
jgi:hypothetical protein